MTVSAHIFTADAIADAADLIEAAFPGLKVARSLTEHVARSLLRRGAATAEGDAEIRTAFMESFIAVTAAATRWPRCCDRWQDGLGGMHCTECSQKTFAMMHDIQQLIGVGKDCKALAKQPSAEAMT